MLLVISLLSISVSIGTADRVVTTNNGPLQGVTVSSGEMEVEAYLGIPYAEPPTDRLRFMKPVPKTRWSGVYDATHLPPVCMQNASYLYIDPNTENMSEDCLYLNLWVPYSEKSSYLKPILLFIHGGAFNKGSSNMKVYDGTNLARFGDVIVASLNYRIGSLGFFLSSIEEACGSMGIYDLIMGFKWIKDNAKFFGGDPEHVVLIGSSAGAMAAGAFLSSPLTSHLMKRVIMQSGAFTTPVALDDNKRLLEMSQILASLTGCANKTFSLKDYPRSVIQCLKNLPGQKIVEADGILQQRYGVTFYPRTGDAFLPKGNMFLIKDGTFADVEMLIGINENEGSLLALLNSPEYFGEYGKNRISKISKRLAGQLMRVGYQKLNVNYSREIADEYLSSVKHNTSDGYLDTVIQSLGDSLVNCDVLYQAEYHSLRNPVYFYVFTRRPSSTPLAEWMKTTHFDEIQYVFGNPLFQNFTPEEAALSNRIMRRWIAFAKTGNPNVPGLKEWPTFTYETPTYLEINDADIVHSSIPDNYRCEFWRKYFYASIDDDIPKITMAAVNGEISMAFNALLIVASVSLTSYKRILGLR